MKRIALAVILGIAFSSASIDQASAATPSPRNVNTGVPVAVPCLKSIQCLQTSILYGNPGPEPAPVDAQPAPRNMVTASLMTIIESQFLSFFARFLTK